MNEDDIVAALKAGGVLSIDWPYWRLDSRHAEEDRPARFAVDDDSMLEEEFAWWDSILLCSDKDTPADTLVRALALVAGVRVRDH